MTKDTTLNMAGPGEKLVKATVVGSNSHLPSSLSTGEPMSEPFVSAGAIEPPHDPEALCRIFEHSNSLRQNVDAYATNIDGFGHRFDPAIDFDDDDADERVAECITLERLAVGDASQEPTISEIAERKSELSRLSKIELTKLRSFFGSCCFDHSFIDLRRRTRQDLEITGNAFWEIIRNGRGELARLVYVPSYSVRLMPLDEQPVEIEERVQVSPVSFEAMSVRRHLRRYVQIQGGQRVFFKAFGDPRVISKKTGRVFASVATLRSIDPSDAPASEMIHFKIHSPRSPYGVPRWIGNLLSVLGSREMEEVNFMYFSNKSVPPLALLVSGGRLSEASVPRIERFIEENLKGKKAFYKMLVLEAEGASSTSETKAKIELRPLTDAQQQDALFQQYDERNIDKVGASFRMPRLLRGESHNFNRSVAESMLRFAEDQVFEPLRNEFDYLMNRLILGDMGIRFWRFKSLTPITRDPERLSNMVEKLVRVGVLTPEEARIQAGDIFNRDFRKLGDDWTKRPITLTLAGIQNQQTSVGEVRKDDSLLYDAERLIDLHGKLEEEEGRLAVEKLNRQRVEMNDGDVEKMIVPLGEFDSWFEVKS